MKKYKIAFVVLLVVAIFFVSLPTLYFANRQRMIQEILKKYPDGDSWVRNDVSDHLYAEFKWHVISTALLLIACYVTATIITIRKCKPKLRNAKICQASLLAPLILLLSGVTFGITPCKPVLATTVNSLISQGSEIENTIDILFVGDEEFMALWERWGWNDVWIPWAVKDLVWEFGLGTGVFVASKEWYALTLGHTLRVHGWETWNSSNSETNSYYMLQEGINDIGWQRGKIWNGTIIDLVMFWTGQQNMDVRGLALPWWYGGIIKWTQGSVDICTQALKHELAHLWDCQHCGNFCIMNPGVVASVWCGTCAAHMMNHFYDHMVVPINISQSDLGTTNPAAGIRWYHYMSFRYAGGTTVIYEHNNAVLRATPASGARFIAYETTINFSSNTTYVYDNPASIEVTLEPLSIEPHFEWKVRVIFHSGDYYWWGLIIHNYHVEELNDEGECIYQSRTYRDVKGYY